MKSTYTKITYRKERAAAIIGFNNPEDGNRIGFAAMTEITEAMDNANQDMAVKSIILTGEGEVFCLGGRIDGFPIGYAMDQKQYSDAMVNMIKHIYASPKPVIAAVNGNAYAGGFMVVESCDLAVASIEAKFGLTELVATGNYPVIALAVNGRSIPKKRLFEIILTGEPITADTANDWNLINCVVSPKQVLEKALAYGDIIASRSSVAVAFGRQIYHQMAELTPQMSMEYAKPALLSFLAMEDIKEGALAAKEKREPNYIGK